MRNSTLLATVLGVSISMTLGCTHVQLQRNTVRQARTLSDIYEQQVLDNLAKFVYDINSLPHFSIADGGTNTVNDQVSGSGTLILPTGANSNLGAGGQRQCNEAWTLTPISDPRKLELMRCTYQRTVACALRTGAVLECKNCQQLINRFYTGRADIPVQSAREATHQLEPCMMRLSEGTEAWQQPTRGTVPPEKPATKSDAPPDKAQDIAGLSGVTADDLNVGCCWFRVCCAKCIGKHRHGCCKIGECCGCYVVVDDNIGQEMLSRLTLVMLNLAQYKGVPPQLPYATQGMLIDKKQRINDRINDIIVEIAESKDKPAESKDKPAKPEAADGLTQRVTEIENLQKVVRDIDAQLNPAPVAGQEQAGVGTSNPLTTWQKMNVLLGPAVSPAPTR